MLSKNQTTSTLSIVKTMKPLAGDIYLPWGAPCDGQSHLRDIYLRPSQSNWWKISLWPVFYHRFWCVVPAGWCLFGPILDLENIRNRESVSASWGETSIYNGLMGQKPMTQKYAVKTGETLKDLNISNMLSQTLRPDHCWEVTLLLHSEDVALKCAHLFMEHLVDAPEVTVSSKWKS